MGNRDPRFVWSCVPASRIPSCSPTSATRSSRSCRGRCAPAITPDASILADLGLDSLKVVELTMLLEKQLGRPVFLPEWIASVDDPADLTVGSLARFLADRK